MLSSPTATPVSTRRRGNAAAQPIRTEAIGRMGNHASVRRGRIPHAVYVEAVGRALIQDWYALEQCEVLTQLELVDQLVIANPSRYLSKGAAVRAILDKAAAQVVAACRQSSDRGSARIASFLEAQARGESVSDIARDWGLTREYVSRRVGRHAIHLVTDRVLALGRRQLVVQERQDKVEGAVEPLRKQSA